MKILFSGFRDSKHSVFGGYDWIAKYPGSTYISSSDVLFAKPKHRWINRLLLDLKTRLMMKDFDVVHYFYGDLSIYYPFMIKHNCKIVTTIHLNEQVPYRYDIYKSLKTCDAVVTLSTYQAKYFKDKYGLNTIFIPHGFNKPSWVLKNCTDKLGRTVDDGKVNVICIGKQYRDNDLLVRVVTKYANEKICFHIVGNKSVHEKLENLDYVYLYNFLDDDEYYSLLKRMDYSFMPLTFATANNTLLESQALGVTSILPKITGIEDYASSENMYYEKVADLDFIFTQLTKKSKNEDLIAYSKKFEWSNIYLQLEELYKTLCNGENK